LSAEFDETVHSLWCMHRHSFQQPNQHGIGS
jgi:hypothetical protein